ncbi:MAG: hypothetical protein LIO85_08015 [Rikenellaceae bacterium]|nr:hypothetical protein [Rikenellaceae bacterium]
MKIHYYTDNRIDVFEDFKQIYGEEADRLYGDKELEIKVITPDDSQYNSHTGGGIEYMKIFLSYTPYLLAYNYESCSRAGFTPEEIHSVIAHEIGHIRALGREFDSLEKEQDADRTASELGLGYHLASGLRKIMDSGTLSPETNREMEQRIRTLHGKE